jgi:hypothetical protein
MEENIYHRLEEFKELIWDDYISEKVISTPYIENNSEFLDEVLFDAFRLHQKSGGTFTIQLAARMVESFLLNSFRYKPDQEDPHQYIDY